MKKYLYLIPVAALAMTACTNESDEFVGTSSANQANEISLFSLAHSSVRGGTGSQSGTLDDAYNMYVVAYQTTPNTGDYFGETEFVNYDTDKWHGSTTRYWPLAESTLNFLAVTSGPTGTTRTWGTGAPASNFANKVVVAMEDNSSEQHDMMWAVGQGSVTLTAGILTFPEVSMEFQHTLSLIKFTEKVTASASGKIKLTSIVLNDAKYDGTLTITCANYNTTPTVANTTHTWGPLGDDQDVAVPGWTGASSALTNTAAYNPVGELMIIPQETAGFASFTVNYQIQNPATSAWENYAYTYTPTTPTGRIVQQGYQYTYNITFNLNEIVIAPTVDTWETGTGGDITIR